MRQKDEIHLTYHYFASDFRESFHTLQHDVWSAPGCSASFAEYSLFYRALLQKRPIILRSLLIFREPCHTSQPDVWSAPGYRASFGADITANVSLFSKVSILLNLPYKTTVEGDFAEQNTKYKIHIHS